MQAHRQSAIPIEDIAVSAYTIPTDRPESDATYAWSSTTLVLVEAKAGGKTSLGYTYADLSTAVLIEESLKPVVARRDAMQVSASWSAMVETIRNLGRPGIASMAISALDNSLWDLKARLLNLPLITLLGAVRETVPIYGSGGFTSYSVKELQAQLGGWVQEQIPRVKMKIGRDPEADLQRVDAVRTAIGDEAELFVDANGGYSRKQALQFAYAFEELGVSWFEEPVSSDDLDGLHLLRDNSPPGMEIAAGEYGYDLPYFQRMLQSRAVDVLQADVTRCGGMTGFLQTAALCEANQLPLSAHCAPAIHAHVGCAARSLRHVEYFHDHARIEDLLFDGNLHPESGGLTPDLSRPGIGLEFKRADAAPYRANLPTTHNLL